MELKEYKQLYGDDPEAAPGRDAINASLREIYGDRKPDEHWGTLVSYDLGGPDPLDGISAYACGQGEDGHLHFVTYGYSALSYDEEAAGREFSGFGFEMTFRLAWPLPTKEYPMWVPALLQHLARHVFESGRDFRHLDWVPLNGPICGGDGKTDLVGLFFAADPKLPAIETPHGRVDFIQAFGITAGELRQIQDKTRTRQEMLGQFQTGNPLLVTDLSRREG